MSHCCEYVMGSTILWNWFVWWQYCTVLIHIYNLYHSFIYTYIRLAEPRGSTRGFRCFWIIIIISLVYFFLIQQLSVSESSIKISPVIPEISYICSGQMDKNKNIDLSTVCPFICIKWKVVHLKLQIYTSILLVCIHIYIHV